jgi:hypothetical protein
MNKTQKQLAARIFLDAIAESNAHIRIMEKHGIPKIMDRVRMRIITIGDAVKRRRHCIKLYKHYIVRDLTP